MPQPPPSPVHPNGPRSSAFTGGLDITVRTGSGAGRTALSAFDRALQRAGVADFNLLSLSSVIPPDSRVRYVDAELAGTHGDVLFCVLARAEADRPGQTVWAGLGWCVDTAGAGVFVEHHADTEGELITLIELSLADMDHHRGGTYGPVQMAVSSARCVDRPVCALVTAAYQVASWAQDVSSSLRPDAGHHHVTPSPAAGAPSAAPRARAGEVSVESSISSDLAHELLELYQASFAELEIDAAARQLIDAQEFLTEVSDPRVDKYIVRDARGAAVGLTTMTSDLTAVPWISPAFFGVRFPEQAAANTLHYLGFTLVRQDQRRQEVFRTMIAEVTRRVTAQRGVVAWDMCRLRQEQGLMAGITSMLGDLADVETLVLDEQTYVASLFHGPHGHSGSRIQVTRPADVAVGSSPQP